MLTGLCPEVCFLLTAVTAIELAQAGYAVVGVDYEVRGTV